MFSIVTVTNLAISVNKLVTLWFVLKIEGKNETTTSLSQGSESKRTGQQENMYGEKIR